MLYYLSGDKMKDFETYKIAEGISVVYVPAVRFKTNEIMISLCTPLKAESASVNAVLAKILSHTTKKYPTTARFNKKLALLYGASVSGTVTKLGENQLVSFAISSLDDKFSLDDTKISSAAFKLLISLLFDVNIDENGDFNNADIEREKSSLLYLLAAENNDKRKYALRRLEENMFAAEPYSINRYGTAHQINDVTSSQLKNALSKLLSSAKIQITVVGNADINDIIAIAKNSFLSIERSYVEPVSAVFIPSADRVKIIEERAKVKQGKLVLGFRVNQQSDFVGNAKMRTFADVFGGGAYSLLFNHVREKLSLCYYCSARYDRRKACVIVQCGCDKENMDKAVAEILNQLEIIKTGDFSDAFQASKLGLADVINGVNDASLSLLSWYSNQILDYQILSPSDSAQSNFDVTFQEVRHCASLLTLDTVYKLVSYDEGLK